MRSAFSLPLFAALLFAADTPPVAPIHPHTVTGAGQSRVDNYFWLREKSSPEVIRYLEAENRYTEARMKHTDALQSTLYGEMLGRIKETDLSVPARRDDYYYYTRTEKGKQYPIWCRKKGSLQADQETLLDGNALAEGQKYFRVGNFSVSPDHRLLAYSTDTSGDEVYTIRVKDLATGGLLSDTVANSYYTLQWANDNRTFFYTTLDSAKRPYQVWRHVLGGAKDELAYHEKDERFNLELLKTSSRAYILISIHSSLTSEVRFLDANRPSGQFEPVLPRRHDVLYDLTHHGDSFYIRTNDGARNFRLVRAPVKDPSKGNWKEALAARDGVTIEGVLAFRNHLVVEERDRGLMKIRVEDLRGAKAHYVEFPEPVYTASVTGNAEFDTPLVRYNYSSLVTPSSVFDYQMETRARELKKQQDVLGGYDPAQYSSERIWATSPDGAQVPISLVYRKGFKKDGHAPALLYGYGSYGIPTEPNFSSARLSLLDRGFVYAIAHIRGGGDLGKTWHEDGRLLKKKNSFSDFIACAEQLVRRKYTSPDRLAILGGSAGGMLMGAAANLRPDLFAAVVAKVPFVDVMNTMLDASLPLTVGEYEEWGNPNEKNYYDYMLSYSPYDNVKSATYPKMLISGGLNDPRVSYWEPAKLTARLRALNAGAPQVVLKTNMGSGHFGASGRYEALKESAFDYAFILDSLGLATTAQRLMTVDDLLAAKTIGELHVSPDGRTAVFAVEGKLMTMTATGGEPAALDAQGASNVRWSPDSKRLAYIAGKAVWTIDLASGKATKVCDYDRGNSFLSRSGSALEWSPDGAQIAFAGTTEPAPAAPDPLVVTRILYKTRTSFSDNRRTHVYVVPAAGGVPRAVTSGGHDEHSLSWSSRGPIVFLSNHEPDPDALLNYDLFAVNPASGAVQQLTRTPGVEMDPVVSPDGRWIAYTATTRRITTIDSVAEDNHLWIVSSDGGAGRELNRALDRRSTSPHWTADSRAILCLAGDHGKTLLLRAGIDGGSSTLLDRNAQLTGLSVAGGSTLFTMSEPALPGEIFRLEGAEPRRLTHVNSDTAGQWRMSQPENVRFRSFDGTEVEGWYYPALNASGRVPMILTIHGGPHGAFGYSFNAAAQIYAARGYAVLAINPRGSSGYGQKFSDGSMGNWGGGDYKDLMAGVDHILKTHSEADPARLGVTGGSYGGFMTNWVITQTSRFKAAVAVASVSNMISFYATSLYQDLVHAEFNGFPWDNYETLWQWSPMKHVKNVATPTLFLHGELDNDVHITQAEEIYTALRQRGVEATLVRYPREGHGFREPGHRIDAARRTIEWMDKYLR